MKEIIDKITSYNLFNYLFPGVLIGLLSGQISNYNLLQKDLVVGVFLYYFIGLIVSRIGSIVVEPVLKALKIVTFSKYEDYVRASQVDVKVETLSETNNTYRGLIATLLTLGIIAAFSSIESSLSLPPIVRFSCLGVGLFVLFIFSYKKQCEYINKRVDAARDRGNSNV